MSAHNLYGTGDGDRGGTLLQYCLGAGSCPEHGGFFGRGYEHAAISFCSSSGWDHVVGMYFKKLSDISGRRGGACVAE